MNLNIEHWKEFLVSSIFTIHNGKGITQDEIEEHAGELNAVQSGEDNNGVLGKIDKAYCEKMNYTISEKPCLTVARSGSAGFVSYQEDGCVVGDSAKILHLIEEEKATKNIYIFLQTILTANRFKYAYGRKVTESKYMEDVIKLPIKRNLDKTPFIDSSCKFSKEGYVPDWCFMDSYISSLKHKPLLTNNKKRNAVELNIDSWKKFKIGNLFDVKLSKGDIQLEEIEKGDIPLVSSGETDNGIVGYIDSNGDGEAEIFTKNKITVDMFCNPFYQENDFFAVSHGRVNVLCPKFDLTKHIGLFICSLIKQEKYKFSYGRAVYSDEISNMEIPLPVLSNDDKSIYIDATKKYSPDGYVPDWLWMENYIKLLPYGDRI